MKKLVSAATSLVMAATMVGAVAPVVAGAADAKKGLSLLAYKDATLSEGVTADGSTVTVSADAVKAGDVTVPVGVYLTESTADLVTIGFGVTVNSDNDDVKNITFKDYAPTDAYFAAAKSFTGADGNEFSTSSVVAFAGTYNSRTGYKAHGSFQITNAASEPMYGANNAYYSLGWNNGAKAYTWFGAKSDDYPVVVFDVTLPKGTAEGEYNLEFVNENSIHGNPLCLLESATKYDAMDRNNLDLSNLTIKVGDAATPQTTTSAQTTASGAQTTTTATTAASTATTGSKTDVDTSNADIVLDFINPESEDGYWHANAGDDAVYVDMHITGKDATVKPTGFALEFTLEGGITTEFEDISPALGGASMSVNGPALAIGCGCPSADGHGTPISADSNIMVYMTLSIPDDIDDGLYEINLSRVQIDKDTNGEAGRYNVAVKPGYVAIGDVSTPQTTTSATTASTAATTTTTATTAKSTGSATSASATTASSTTASGANTGDPNYGDTNCDGVVKINDVVLLNKYLNDNKSYAISDQGKLNADCYNPKGGAELTAEDSDAIIKSIVHLVTLPVNK